MVRTKIVFMSLRLLIWNMVAPVIQHNLFATMSFAIDSSWSAASLVFKKKGSWKIVKQEITPISASYWLLWLYFYCTFLLESYSLCISCNLFSFNSKRYSHTLVLLSSATSIIVLSFHGKGFAGVGERDEISWINISSIACFDNIAAERFKGRAWVRELLLYISRGQNSDFTNLLKLWKAQTTRIIYARGKTISKKVRGRLSFILHKLREAVLKYVFLSLMWYPLNIT